MSEAVPNKSKKFYQCAVCTQWIVHVLNSWLGFLCNSFFISTLRAICVGLMIVKDGSMQCQNDWKCREFWNKKLKLWFFTQLNSFYVIFLNTEIWASSFEYLLEKMVGILGIFSISSRRFRIFCIFPKGEIIFFYYLFIFSTKFDFLCVCCRKLKFIPKSYRRSNNNSSDSDEIQLHPGHRERLELERESGMFEIRRITDTHTHVFGGLSWAEFTLNTHAIFLNKKKLHNDKCHKCFPPNRTQVLTATSDIFLSIVHTLNLFTFPLNHMNISRVQ